MNPENKHPRKGRVLALDYGRAHTGVAISDPSALLARPLEDIEQGAGPAGIGNIVRLITEKKVFLVIVGMPVSLSGNREAQARETEEFMESLQARVDVPVIAWDERFTSKMAKKHAASSRASAHGLAACILLDDYLKSAEYQRWLEIR